MQELKIKSVRFDESEVQSLVAELLEPLANGTYPRTASRVLPGKVERHTQHEEGVGQGARVGRRELREVDESGDSEDVQSLLKDLEREMAKIAAR